MAHVANEAFLLARMEEFFSPRPAKLWDENEDDEINRRLDKAVAQMGGPPRLILRRVDDPPPIVDSYPEAALREVVSAFDRARKSVCRAHLFMVGSDQTKKRPDLIGLKTDEELGLPFSRIIENTFWEHTETAYIRLASYWDRVGQVLDFAFFRIRQFEHDGFSGVMDRIRTNVIPMNQNFAVTGSWKALRSYQTSDKDDGLKWLLRRRNITIHSLHLRAIDEATDEVAFKAMYNHLEEALKGKLSPRSPMEEINQLHIHLEKAASNFRNMLDVIENGFHLHKR